MYDTSMTDPLAWTGLATNLLALILRMSNQTTGAEVIVDAHESLGLLARLKRAGSATHTPIARLIGQNLEDTTRRFYDQYRVEDFKLHELSTAATEVEILLTEIANDDSLIILAVRSEEAFRETLRTKAAKHRARLEQGLEPYFDALIDAVTKEYIKLAPWSDHFEPVAFKYVFGQLEIVCTNTERIVEHLNILMSDMAELRADQTTITQILTNKDNINSHTTRITSGNRPYVGTQHVVRNEQSTLYQYVLKESAARTVLIGMRGSGKSQLASSLAHHCEYEGWELVAWINATSINSLRSNIIELGYKLGIRADESTTEEQLVRRCLDHIRSHNTANRLIVLDNVEDIDNLTNLIPEGEGLRVVATTNSIRGWKQQSWRVINVDMFSSQEALSFLLNTTGSTDSKTAATICERLGNLPLALSQAAATVCGENWSLKQYLKRLNNYKSEFVIRPIPGDSYREDVSTALLFAARSALGNLYGQQLEIARQQLRILALLAASGIPTRWLDPFADSSTEDLTFDTTSENAHSAMSALINTSVIQKSDKSDIVMLHRLQGQVIREYLKDNNNLKTAQSDAAELLASINLDKLPLNETFRHRDETRKIIEQFRCIGTQSYSHKIFEHEVVHTCLENVFTHATELGLTYDALTLKESVQIIEDIIGVDNKLAMCLRGHLAVTYRSSGQLKLATELFETNLNNRRNTLGEEDNDTLRAENELANAYREAGRLTEAIQLYQHTLEVRARVAGCEHPNTQVSRGNLAAAYKEIGKYSDAIELGSKNLEIRLRLYGPKDPKTLFSQASLANSYMEAGRFNDAIELHISTFKTREEVWGKTHLRTIRSQVALARAYREKGDLEQAFNLFFEALLLRRELQGKSHPATLIAQDGLARTYLAMDALDDARQLFEQTLQQRQETLGAQHPRTLVTQDGLARTYLALGRNNEAIDLHKRTVIRHLNILGPSHPKTLIAQDGLARAYFAVDQYSMATELHHIVLCQRRSVLGAHHPYTVTSYSEFRKAYRFITIPHE